jgi:hypothetical protein
LIILWLLRSLAGGAGGSGGASRDTDIDGSSPIGGSEPSYDLVDEYYGADLFIAEWEGQKIDRAYQGMYDDSEPDYSEAYTDYLAEEYSDMYENYDEYEAWDAAASAEGWPGYP